MNVREDVGDKREAMVSIGLNKVGMHRRVPRKGGVVRVTIPGFHELQVASIEHFYYSLEGGGERMSETEKRFLGEKLKPACY